MMFQLGQWTLYSGQQTNWRVYLGDLPIESWHALAQMAKDILPHHWGAVETPPGAKRPDMLFALALGRYSMCQCGEYFKDHGVQGHTMVPNGPLLICQGVVTDGRGMELQRLRCPGVVRHVPYQRSVVGCPTHHNEEGVPDPDAMGIVVFSRMPECPEWITPLFKANRLLLADRRR